MKHFITTLNTLSRLKVFWGKKTQQTFKFKYGRELKLLEKNIFNSVMNRNGTPI